MIKYLFSFLLLFYCHYVFSKSILNVYNWADYFPPEVIETFEKETSIQINYTEYDSNEILYAKLKSNSKIGYDVIFPSSYYLFRMASEKMLLPLDKTKLSNFRHLNSKLLNQPFDRHNQYSVPYLWGTTGIVINKKFIKQNTVTGWSDFWLPKFKNQLLLFDDMREVFAIALLKLGYSINDIDPKHIEQAYHQLKLLWPNIKLFSLDAEQNIYIDEDAVIGMGFNGEIYNASEENNDLEFIYPKEGFEIWLDCIAIPVNAPHVNEALIFINYLLRPEVAAKIAIYTGFSTPNLSAIRLLPIERKTNYLINPPNTVLKKGQFLLDLGDNNAIYQKYWNMLKIGG